MKAEDWLDDLSVVASYAGEQADKALMSVPIPGIVKNAPIVKAMGQVAANPTAQNIGSKIYDHIANLPEGIGKSLEAPEGYESNFPLMNPDDPVDVMKAARFGQSVDEVNKRIKNADYLAMSFSPGAIGGTIIGKGAKGWAQAENKFSSMFDKMERAEISDVGAKLKVENGYLDATLGEILEHNKLFEQYPELKQIKTSININPKYSGGSAFYPSARPFVTGPDGSVYVSKGSISAQGRTPEEARSSLLHEIQHAIQGEEGFPRGGSITGSGMRGPEAKLKLEDIERKRQVIQDAKTTEASILVSRAKDNPEYKRFVDEAWTEWKNKLGEKTRDNPYGVDLETAVKYSLIEKDPSFISLTNTAEELRPLARLSPNEVYMRLPGEIEARSVARRANIPQEQLKYSQPYAGENIPLKEWIKAEDFLDQ